MYDEILDHIYAAGTLAVEAGLLGIDAMLDSIIEEIDDIEEYNKEQAAAQKQARKAFGLEEA